MSPTRGLFIVFEGLDRSGKSTQVARLVDHLNKLTLTPISSSSCSAANASIPTLARIQKFPDRTTSIGKMIDAYLQSQSELDDHAIHLLFSANRWECAAVIEKELAQGITVVADRYAFSGIAFSAAKGLPFNFCLQPDAGLPLPDLTIYLTLPPSLASQRGEFGNERYETVDMQTRVRSEFKSVAQEMEKRHGHGKWVEVSAEGSIEEVEERVWQVVKGLVEAERKQLGKLWT